MRNTLPDHSKAALAQFFNQFDFFSWHLPLIRYVNARYIFRIHRLNKSHVLFFFLVLPVEPADDEEYLKFFTNIETALIFNICISKVSTITFKTYSQILTPRKIINVTETMTIVFDDDSLM